MGVGVYVGTRVWTGARPACPSGSSGDRSGVPEPPLQPGCGHRAQLLSGAALPAKRIRMAGAARRRADITSPIAGIPAERRSSQPCFNPPSLPSQVLASAGCLICRKPGGFGAELPHHLPSSVICLSDLVGASLTLVTLMTV